MAEKSLEDIRADLCMLFEKAVNESRMSTYSDEEQIAKATYMGSAGQLAMAIAKIDEVTAASAVSLGGLKSPRT